MDKLAVIAGVTGQIIPLFFIVRTVVKRLNEKVQPILVKINHNS